MKYKVSDLQFYKALQKVEKALEEGNAIKLLEPSIQNIRQSAFESGSRFKAFFNVRKKYYECLTKELENDDEAISN